MEKDKVERINNISSFINKELSAKNFELVDFGANPGNDIHYYVIKKDGQRIFSFCISPTETWTHAGADVVCIASLREAKLLVESLIR